MHKPSSPASAHDRDVRVHRWGPGRVRYTVAGFDGDHDVHEGPNLGLESIIRWETEVEPLEDLSLTFDRVVWVDEQVVAIIRQVEGRQPFAIRVEPTGPIPWEKGQAVPDDEGDDD